jgi:hypothetical protein
MLYECLSHPGVTRGISMRISAFFFLTAYSLKYYLYTYCTQTAVVLSITVLFGILSIGIAGHPVLIRISVKLDLTASAF